MALILHIIIALSSLFYTVYVFFYPTKNKITAAYGLVALTFVSGFYLILTTHTHILQTCVTGLAYLAVLLVGIQLARHKLSPDGHHRGD